MVWGLFPVDPLPGEDRYYIFSKGIYKVGRKGCHIIINKDKGVSRIHAEIIIDEMICMDHVTKKSSNISSKVWIRDCSKFGTFIDKNVGMKEKVHESPNKEIMLNDGDLISFGTGNATYRFCFISLVFFMLSSNLSEMNQLQEKISMIGASVARSWSLQCTHMVIDDFVSINDQLIDAILAKKTLVRCSWIEFIAGKTICTEIPSTLSHAPNLMLEGVSVKVTDTHSREHCLGGYTFLLESIHKNEALLVEARLSRAPVPVGSDFASIMARLSAVERANKRSSNKRPATSQSATADSEPVEPPTKQARSVPSQDQTTSSPVVEVKITNDLAPPKQSTSVATPSVFHPSARGYALSLGDSLVRDVDRGVMKDASTKALAEATCMASLQLMTIQNVWAQKCRSAIGNWHAVQCQLEKEQADHASRMADMEARVAKLERALLTVDAEVAKARIEAVEDFKHSTSFADNVKAAVAEGIEAYKKSDECLDWADERSVDYLELGFARCRLQIEQANVLPPDTDLSFLNFGKETPGEPTVGEAAAEGETP